MNRTRAAVLGATGELLVDHGYAAITVEKIAAECGVARSTIYRHWDNLAEIVFDTLQDLLGPVMSLPETGNLRDDLIEIYGVLTHALTEGSWGKLVRGVVEAAMADELFAGVLQQAIADRRENGKAVLQQAIDRGELPADVNMGWFLDSISGVIYYRLLMSGSAPDEPGMLEHLIDAAITAASASPSH